MLLGISVILLFGLLAGKICSKLNLPSLCGMILAGIVIGPDTLDLIGDSILKISDDIRKIALIIILLRAGLTLKLSSLKKIGKPAILMCFLPACFEMIGMILLAPHILGVSAMDAAIIGTVVGAVSPAIIVPRMIKLIENEIGTEKGIPQLILAGASVDDVFVIVMFGVFTGIVKGSKISVMTFINVPMSIIFGMFVGMLAGIILSKFFEKFHMRDTVKVLITLSAAFIFASIEDFLSADIPFSGLIAVMFMGIILKREKSDISQRLSEKLNKLWCGAEIFLFVLVGASVNIGSAAEYGVMAVLLIFGVLLFRILGVLLCLVGTKFNLKERIFCVITYMPKATVQAAIGGLPLAMGLDCGSAALTVSVLSILITAPLGAIGIDYSYKKLLKD